MRRASSVLCASFLITMISTTTFAGSITTLRSSRSGSITTLSTGNRGGSITTLATGSITTLRTASITTLSTSDTASVPANETSTGLGRFTVSDLLSSYFSMLLTIW
jgi:hypothetical protein